MRNCMFVTWNAASSVPFENIIFDEVPKFDLYLFDYSGKYSANHPPPRAFLHSLGKSYKFEIYSLLTEGKGQILEIISDIVSSKDANYVGILDDDILIKISCLNRALLIASNQGFSAFQPSLTRYSFFSHKFTIQRRKNAYRCVPWIEIMMPIIKKDLLIAAKPFLAGNISSWGLDCYVFPMLSFIESFSGGHAVIDLCIATHLRPISSGDKIYSNNLSAAQEMLSVNQACKLYLSSRGIRWQDDEFLFNLLSVKQARDKRTLLARLLSPVKNVYSKILNVFWRSPNVRKEKSQSMAHSVNVDII